MLAFGDVRSYYARLPIIFDNARDMTTTVFGTPGSPEASAALLQRNGIAYLLIEDIGTVDQAPAAPAVARREQQNFQQFAARYLTPVFTDADVRVYRFSPQGTAP